MTEGQIEQVEQAEIDAYMDPENSNGEGPTTDERKRYMQQRYEAVQQEYKMLTLQREEVEAMKQENVRNRMMEAFRENYMRRKWCVKALRNLGEKIVDKFIPG